MTIPTLSNVALNDAGTGPYDLAFLTGLANEIFQTPPGGTTAVPSAASLPPAGTGVPPGGVPVAGFGAAPPAKPPVADVPGAPADTPGDADMRALLAPIFATMLSPLLAEPSLPPAGGLGASPVALPGFAAIPDLSSANPLDAELLSPVPPALPPHGAAGQGAQQQQAVPFSTLPWLPEIPPLAADIPGEAELRAMLAPSGANGQAAPTLAATPATTPNFYFLDPATKPAADPATLSPGAHPAFDAAARRADFPILAEQINGRPLIWLDNAATTQKPQAVIDRLGHFYRHENSNIHRAAHELAARATDAYENAREAIRRFLGAPAAENIVFVRGTTEGINLIAKSWGRQHVHEGDEILITWLEHHANIVPWQQLAADTGAKLRVAPVDDSGQLRLDEFEKLLTDRTKLVSVTHVSNALGTVTPVRELTRMARRHGAHVLIDGAQSTSHMPIDVQDLDCDWFVFSGHKLFAPTGIGAVFARTEVWNATPPWQGGGNMIRDVTFDKVTYQDPPHRFEAGTGNIADAAGLAAAIEYLERIGMENIAAYEHDLLAYGTRLLSDIPGLRLIGTAAEKAGVLSFVLKNIPPEQVGRALNDEGIAVRAGHHCAQPILRRFGLEATIRPSLAFYNTHADLDALAAALHRIQAGAPP